ncbi:DUF349 domain-containing protein [Salinispirillum sp. LH 10-3-1]|uniref:DUF349 domain-containing protein n=1 Tax=Salinispirillum sp. LH 10-3-1 TaxID=2952525 RepID=A0AB38YDZ5_9GAMM
MSATNDRAALEDLLQHENTQLQVAALHQLADLQVTQRLLQEGTSPELAVAAKGLIRDALSHHSVQPEELTLLPTAMRYSLLLDCDLARAEQWLQTQSDEVCLDLALNAVRAQERLSAANALREESSLQALQRAAKGSDNVLYKLAKGRLQALREQRQGAEARAEQIAHILATLEKLVNSPYDPLLEGRLQNQVQQFHELLPTTDELNQLVPLEAAVRARIAAEQQIDHMQAAEQVANDVATSEAHRVVAETTNDMRRQLANYLEDGRLLPDDWSASQQWLEEQRQAHRDAVAHLNVAPAMNADMQKTSQLVEQSLLQLHDITEYWGGLSAALAAAEDDDATALKALRALLQPLQQQKREPGEWPEIIDQVAAKLGHVAALQAEHKDAELAVVRKVRGLIRRGRGAVRGGHLRQARGIWHTIEEALQAVPVGHDHLHQEAAEYHQEVEQLGDWQAFAVLPKKQELIEHMRALTERSMHPQDKSDAVQALQKAWRELSKGGGDQHQNLWEEFHALAEQAFAPCKDYFAEQDALMDLNADKRRELIGQLNLYFDNNDWHNPDWAEVEKVLRLAARDWRHYSPVKPQEHRRTEKVYHQVVERIRQKLNEEFTRNKEDRERIIAAAEALRDEENLRVATDKLKALQQQWKQAGRTHRQDDQRLWQAFRTICDEIFDRRDTLSQEFKGKLDQHLKDALALIVRLEKAAELEGDALTAALQQLPAWEAEFKTYSPLPKARLNETRARFAKAVDALRNAKGQRQQRQQEQSWQALFDRLRILAGLEAAMCRGEFDNDLRAQVQSVWEDGTALPSLAARVDDRFQMTMQRFAAGARPADGTPEECVRKLHQQCVLVEILTDTASPDADRTLRMEVQVARLAEGLGQHSNRATVEQALVDWLVVPVCCDSVDYDALHERVKQASMNYFFK